MCCVFNWILSTHNNIVTLVSSLAMFHGTMYRASMILFLVLEFSVYGSTYVLYRGVYDKQL